MNNNNNNRASLDRFEHTRKVYFKEWKVDHLNKDTYPGMYDPNLSLKVKKPKQFTISREDRGLLPFKKPNSLNRSIANTIYTSSNLNVDRDLLNHLE